MIRCSRFFKAPTKQLRIWVGGIGRRWNENERATGEPARYPVDSAPPRYRTAIGAASLIVGPALMSVGDLLHPAEHWDAAAQATIVAHSASRWYAAHLLLFAGLLLLVPGILALTKVAMDRRPVVGY